MADDSSGWSSVTRAPGDSVDGDIQCCCPQREDNEVKRVIRVFLFGGSWDFYIEVSQVTG